MGHADHNLAYVIRSASAIALELEGQRADTRGGWQSRPCRGQAGVGAVNAAPRFPWLQADLTLIAYPERRRNRNMRIGP